MLERYHNSLSDQGDIMLRNINLIIMASVFVGCMENWHTTMVKLNLAACFINEESVKETALSGGICEFALKEYIGENEVVTCLVLDSENNHQTCIGLWKPVGDIALEGCSSKSGELEELNTEGDKLEVQLFIMDIGVPQCPADLEIGTSCANMQGCLLAFRPASAETDFDDEKISLTYGDTGDEKPCQPECVRSELCLAPGATVASCLNPEPAEGEGEGEGSPQGEGEGEGEEPPPDECDGCFSPPPKVCDGGDLVEYVSPGICVRERCFYNTILRPCDFGCTEAECLPDPCPLNCEGEGEGAGEGEGEGSAVESEGEPHVGEGEGEGDGEGEGEGEGEGSPAGEGEGEGGEGEGPPHDPCEDVICEEPPSDLCDLDGDVVDYAPEGACAEGDCNYDFNVIPCDFGCAEAQCLPDPCEDVVCNDREPRCEGNVLVTEVNGQCDDGVCNYERRETFCAFGCNAADPSCNPDPCLLGCEGEGEGSPGEGEGEGIGEGEGEPNPCEGLLLCEEEEITCDGHLTIIKCQMNADGCLVETREPPPEGWSCISPTGPDGFLMGSPPDEVGRGDDEVQHRVVITRPFIIQQTEVRQEEWRTLMGNNPSAFGGCDTCPVETVNWFDAIAYANALSRAEGFEECYVFGAVVSWLQGLDCTGYRLPTEAEWEYAARAGSEEARYAEPLADLGWYSENSGARTNPAGQKLPNGWGLYDMLGNVWEPMWDINGVYPADAVVDPIGPPAEEGNRVIRGGAWNHLADDCRTANRSATNPGSKGGNIGFRMVRTIQ